MTKKELEEKVKDLEQQLKRNNTPLYMMLDAIERGLRSGDIEECEVKTTNRMSSGWSNDKVYDIRVKIEK